MTRAHGSERGVFVTGTDTGVGKTLVSCALAAWGRASGMDVGVMKPIATGGVKAEAASTSHRRAWPKRQAWISPDAVQLSRAAQVNDADWLINPVCYREPLAPYAAALRSDRPVEWARIRRAFHRLMRRHDVLIVEGVGGLLVPLSRRRTVADLIRMLRLPCLIVSRLGLGTLNHTLLTVQAAQRAGLRVLGVVVNAEPPGQDRAGALAERTNVSVLTRCLRVPVFGPLPRYRGDPSCPGALAAWISGALPPGLLSFLFKSAPGVPARQGGQAMAPGALAIESLPKRVGCLRPTRAHP